jgi:predicted Ser/Thr protein kinase
MIAPDDATIDQSTTPSSRQPEPPQVSGSALALAEILDRYMAALQAGKAPDRGQLLAAHPELATQLEACLAGIEFVNRATGSAAEQPATLGEFRIIRELGRGGMGVVYEAEQTSLRRHVALKVLRFGVVADAEAMQRFHREAETVARLHHTHIVPIFAIGCEQGVHYYAMQFIHGRSLAEALRTGQPLSLADVAQWGLQAAEALAHAHQRGVIHRDIKPSNLLLDAEGLIWLTDFGLAKRADEATLTLSGALMGTPRYMSPEQAESLRHPIDHRTDLYSLGATLYELATGRPVFDSDTPHGVIAQILTEEPPRPRQSRPDLSPDFETIILTCLAKEPARRYATAQALAEDLRAARDGRPIQVLSGRSGRRLWSAGPLPSLGFELAGSSYVEGIDVRAREGQDRADLLVVHDARLAKGGFSAAGVLPLQTRLARLSGRDGGVVWDVSLAEHRQGISRHVGFPHEFGDVDGDGGLDVVLRSYAAGNGGSTASELHAVSFRDGKSLWNHPIRDPKAPFAVGDLDGDGRAEVVVRDQPPHGSKTVIELRVLDGCQGATRWTWRGGEIRDPANPDPSLCLADFEGNGRREVCLGFDVASGRRVVILDAQGQERAARDLGPERVRVLACADLDGDGRDELLLQDVEGLHACRGNLKALWSWTSRKAAVQQIIPAREELPATVVLDAGVGLDGATGRPRWAGRPARRLLEADRSAHRPRPLVVDAGQTICSMVLPTTPQGVPEPARGTPVPPGLVSRDPRWERPLPWSRGSGGMVHPLIYLRLAGLALVNVVLPLVILRAATRRRVWGVRLLMALPAVVAIPLAAFLMLRSVTPAMASVATERLIMIIILCTLAGLPALVYVTLIASSVLHRRWIRLAVLGVLTVLASVAVGAYWLGCDLMSKPAIEHYTWSGWHGVVLPGAYAVGVLVLIAWAVRGVARLVMRLWRNGRVASHLHAVS